MDNMTVMRNIVGPDGRLMTISHTGDGPMRVSTLGGQSFAMNAAGERMSVADSLPSACGALFDEYVKRAIEPFPYNSMSPAYRDVENFWQGRRLRLLTVPNGEDWKEGQVVKWCQWNTGPFCPCTFWKVTIRLEPPEQSRNLSPEKLFRKGDLVMIRGLVNAKEHNGEEATVQEYIEDSGRFLVKYGPQRKKKRLCVKPANLEAVIEVERELCRVNIRGGGTLEGRHADDAELLSFEWLSPAVPDINLEEGDTSCPTCRALQPYQAGAAARSFETAEQLEPDAECPVCFETASCLQLSCEHFVCQPCWESWCRRQGTNEETTRELEEEFDPAELETRRAELLQDLEDRVPTAWSPPDCEPDGTPIMTERRELWNEYEYSFAEQLIVDWQSGPEGRRRFRRTLMEAPLYLLNSHAVFPQLEEELPVPALEIHQEIMDKRFASGCFLDMARRFVEKEGVPPTEKPDQFSVEKLAREQFGRWTGNHANSIGLMLEELDNYRAALPWHEKSLERARLTSVLVRAEEVSSAQFVLASTHERLGNLSTALQLYDESMTVPSDFRDECSGERDNLLVEMKKWTGTSGKMTPE